MLIRDGRQHTRLFPRGQIRFEYTVDLGVYAPKCIVVEKIGIPSHQFLDTMPNLPFLAKDYTKRLFLLFRTCKKGRTKAILAPKWQSV